MLKETSVCDGKKVVVEDRLEYRTCRRQVYVDMSYITQ